MKAYLVVTDIIVDGMETRNFEAFVNKSDAQDAAKRHIDEIRSDFECERSEEEQNDNLFCIWWDGESFGGYHGRVELVEVEING